MQLILRKAVISVRNTARINQNKIRKKLFALSSNESLSVGNEITLNENLI